VEEGLVTEVGCGLVLSDCRTRPVYWPVIALSECGGASGTRVSGTDVVVPDARHRGGPPGYLSISRGLVIEATYEGLEYTEMALTVVINGPTIARGCLGE